MSTTPLEREIKNMIIDTLQLEDITVDDIDSDAPLFNEGLGLDSIDALELGVALHRNYGIRLDSESEQTRQYFANVKSLAELVRTHQSSQG